MKTIYLVLGILLGTMMLSTGGAVFITDQAIDYREFSGSITDKYSVVVQRGFGSEEKFYFIIDDTAEVNVGRQAYFQHDVGDNYVQTTKDLTSPGHLSIIGIVSGTIIILLTLFLHASDQDRRYWDGSSRRKR